MRHYAHHRVRDAVTGIGAVLAIIVVVGAILWGHLNYKCISQHYEWRRDCTTHRNSEGKRTGETCRDRRVEVCDTWEER